MFWSVLWLQVHVVSMRKSYENYDPKKTPFSTYSLQFFQMNKTVFFFRGINQILPVYESGRNWIGGLLLISWNEITRPSLCFTWVLQEKKTLRKLFIEKTGFNQIKNFCGILLESCSIEIFSDKKNLGGF